MTHAPPFLQLVGNNIPPEFHSAIEKGFREAANSGALIGAPVEVRVAAAAACLLLPADYEFHVLCSWALCMDWCRYIVSSRSPGPGAKASETAAARAAGGRAEVGAHKRFFYINR